MKTIKKNEKYKLCDVRNTYFQGPYQILEITQEFTDGRTCGIYQSKKSALEVFNKLMNK